MKAVLENEVLRGYFEAIYEMNDRARIQITSDGFYTQTLEPGHVAMVIAKIPKEYFDEYELEKDMDVVLPIEKIVKFLKNIDKDSKIEITIDENRITLKGKNIKRNFALVDEEINIPKIPEIEFTAEYNFLPEDFIDVLRAIKMAKDITSYGNETITIESKDKHLFIRADSVDDEVELKLYGSNGEAKANYSIDFIENIFKRIFAVSKSILVMTEPNIKMEWAKDKPLRISVGHISYLVAPRIVEYGE